MRSRITLSRATTRILAAAALVLPTAGCAAYAVSPVSGYLYSDVRAPLAATAYPTGTRTGTATCSSILGLIATGDCSIEAAMRAGGITRIHHVDYQSTSLLGLFANYIVTVYGEAAPGAAAGDGGHEGTRQ